MEKKFPPSAKKLQDLRKKGDVPKSVDLPSSIVLLMFVIVMALGAPMVWNSLSSLLINGLELAFADAATVSATSISMLLLQYTFVPLFIAGIVGTAVSFLTIGAVFSAEPITPKLEKLNPASGLKRMFSGQQFVGLIKSLVAIIFLLGAFWLVMRYNLKPLAHLAFLPPESALRVGLGMLLFALIVAGVTGIVIGVLEFSSSRFFYIKKNMMTREEVDRENKDQMGNPLVKSRRRQIALEDIENDAVSNVSGAELMIVNPTHIAIAIKGEGKNKDIPVVIAKGRGLTAQKMREKAQKEGIPIVRNRALARSLFIDAKLRLPIPKEYLVAVNQTLAWVRKMETFKKQQAAQLKKGVKTKPQERDSTPPADRKKT
jgi:type III secretion protein U